MAKKVKPLPRLVIGDGTAKHIAEKLGFKLTGWQNEILKKQESEFTEALRAQIEEDTKENYLLRLKREKDRVFDPYKQFKSNPELTRNNIVGLLKLFVNASNQYQFQGTERYKFRSDTDIVKVTTNNCKKLQEVLDWIEETIQKFAEEQEAQLSKKTNLGRPKKESAGTYNREEITFLLYHLKNAGIILAPTNTALAQFGKIFGFEPTGINNTLSKIKGVEKKVKEKVIKELENVIQLMRKDI